MRGSFWRAMNTVGTKVQEIFGDRSHALRGDRFPTTTCTLICNALCDGDSSEATVLLNDQIALNVADWNSDAAFIVALSLFPERFSDAEIRDGVHRLLIHVPDHVIEAAQLAGLSSNQ
jgi:hypothetical protein